MKKTISVILSLVLMLGLLALPVGATDDVATRVYLDAPAQAATGEEIGVALYVNGNVAAGGVQGTVNYNVEHLDYVGVELRDDMKDLGNTEDVTVKADETAGKINFVGLSNVAGGTAPADAWLTLKFTVKMTNAGDTTLVYLSDVKAADKAGTTALDATLIDTQVRVIEVNVNDVVDMDGATIKTDLVHQGIRFQATPDLSLLDPAVITEIGVVIMPSSLMYEGQDLTVDTIGKGGAEPAVAKITATENADLLDLVKGGEALYATLVNGTTNGRANLEIVARAFVEVGGETVYYSHNDIADKDVTAGEANKSLVSVAQAIAATQIANGATDTLGELLTKTTKMTNAEVTTLLTFCRDNYDYLGA